MVLDLHFPMNRFLHEKRNDHSEFQLVPDGIHPNSQGHWIMAREIIRFLEGKGKWVEAEEFRFTSTPDAQEIMALVQQRQHLLRDAWLTETGHLRPGLPAGKPLDQALQEAKILASRIQELAQSKSAKKEVHGVQTP